MRLQGTLFDSDRPVQQLICSGNIAASWSDDHLYALVSAVQNSFTLAQENSGWCACLGTTGVTESRLRLLQVLGFLKIRFAVHQDNGGNAAGAHRVLEDIETLARLARRLGMRQIMIDLYCSASGKGLSSARLAAFVDAVKPELLRLIDSGSPASAAQPLQRDDYAALLAGIGYENLGLDWFLRPGGLWGRPAAARRLHWSLLGYTDMPSPDVVGIGPGAISTIGEFYSQNEHRPHPYEDLVNEGLIPTARGLELESDDRLRREIMSMMLTEGRIDIRAIENKWGIQFRQFFSREMKQLSRFQNAGTVDVRTDAVIVPARGRRELRKLCETFNRRIRMVASGNAPSVA